MELDLFSRLIRFWMLLLSVYVGLLSNFFHFLKLFLLSLSSCVLMYDFS